MGGCRPGRLQRGDCVGACARPLSSLREVRRLGARDVSSPPGSGALSRTCGLGRATRLSRSPGNSSLASPNPTGRNHRSSYSSPLLTYSAPGGLPQGPQCGAGLCLEARKWQQAGVVKCGFCCRPTGRAGSSTDGRTRGTAAVLGAEVPLRAQPVSQPHPTAASRTAMTAETRARAKLSIDAISRERAAVPA